MICRKLLATKLTLSSVFVFFFLSHVYGQSSHPEVIFKSLILTAKQERVSIQVAGGIYDGLAEAHKELNKKGIEAKESDVIVMTGGDPDKENFALKITINFKKIVDQKDEIVIEKEWSKCPEPDSAEVKEIIKIYTEKVIEVVKEKKQWI